MIIELPVLPSDGATKRYRMGFFHFSNNNLSIRRQCAVDAGMYDQAMRTSEDVDICFRVAACGDWVACREPGVVVRHKARRTVGAMMKQLWGWGINLGRVYKKTGITGIYLYWVSSTKHTISRDLEIGKFPKLVCAFLTAFHVAHGLAAAALVLGVLGSARLAAVAGILAVLLLLRSMWDVFRQGLGPARSLKLAGVAYLANLAFITAAFVGGIRAGMVLVPSSMFPPSAVPDGDSDAEDADQ